MVLCESQWEAEELFELWMMVLVHMAVENIRRAWPECLAVETDDDLRYIFVDYRMEHAFDNMKPDIVDSDEFLIAICDLYPDYFLESYEEENQI